MRRSDPRVPEGLRAGLLLVIVLLGALAPLPVTADNPQGPPLSVPGAKLSAALRCPRDLRSVTRDVVLLVPPTTLDPEEAYGWTYMRAFDGLGFPYCFVVLPDRSMGDIQVSSEYVVFSIREINRLSRRKVTVFGWSQGGTNPRWALRWWPDLRGIVDEYVALAPSAHGTLMGDVLCVPSCAPAMWQQNYMSNFIRAMNSGGETFPGIDYTVVWTRYDEFLLPPGSSTIAGATNIATQDVCPANTADHGAIGHDPVAYALVIDALTHPGPASLARIDGAVCSQTLAPMIDPFMFPANIARVTSRLAIQLATYPHVTEEPPLKAYARNYCDAHPDC